MAKIIYLLRIPQGKNDMPLFVEHLTVPAYGMPKTYLVCEVVGPLSPWYLDIFNYLHDATFPPNITHSKKCNLIQHIAR